MTYNKKEASIVNAKKSDVLKHDEQTRLLSRNWNMTPEKNGKDSLRANIKKSTVLFTRNGTYLVQAFGESNKNPVTSLYNWQWHSKDPNKFVIWKEWDKMNEDRNSTIQKLSETTLWIGGTTFGYEFEAIK